MKKHHYFAVNEPLRCSSARRSAVFGLPSKRYLLSRPENRCESHGPAVMSWECGNEKGNERERDQRSIKALQGSSPPPSPLVPAPPLLRHSPGRLCNLRPQVTLLVWISVTAWERSLNPACWWNLSMAEGWLSSFTPTWLPHYLNTWLPDHLITWLPDHLRPAGFSAVVTLQASAGFFTVRTQAAVTLQDRCDGEPSSAA